MTESSLADLTLREKLKDAENLARQLIDHLERGFIPKVHSLRRLARQANDPDHRESITDLAIREGASGVIQSDDYTRQLSEKTHAYLESIAADVDALFNS